MSVARVKLARKRLNISAHPPWTKRPEDRQKAWDKPWIHRSAPRFARLWCAGKSTANIAAIMKLSRPQTMLLCVMSRKLLGVEQVPYRRFSKKAS